MSLKATLRIICTTDLHMHLSARHPITGAPVAQGLEALEPLIEAARSEVPLHLLVDNGDILQGTPMGEWAARDGLDQAHPARQSLAALGFDATTLGNHEFDFGLGHLNRALQQDGPPTVCCNILGDVAVAQSVLVERFVAGERLLIGITGSIPPRVLVWHRDMLSHVLEITPVADAVAAEATELRARGADLVICLAHAGIVPDNHPEEAGENTALAIAATGAVDAIVCGHQHMLFPDPDFAYSDPGIDPVAGTLHGVPSIMPPALGSGLGVLDLKVVQDGAGWSVTSHHGDLRRPDASYDSPRLRPLLAPAEAATDARLDEALSRTDVPLSTAFSVAEDGVEMRLIHAAQLWAAREQDFGLPLLSAASPFKTGGRSGPDAYTRIASGALSRRSVVDLYPYENALTVLQATGAELLDWLEMSASAYNTCAAHAKNDLLEADRAGFNVDSLCGLSYDIDLSAHGRYDITGAQISAARRCRNICFAGTPVDPDARFAVVTNAYRAGGGGSFPHIAAMPVLWSPEVPVSDLIVAYLRAHSDGALLPEPFWKLTGPSGAVLRHCTDALAEPPTGWVRTGSSAGYGVFERTL